MFQDRSTSPQNIEIDSDSEPDFTPRPEQEELELEEVTAADDLSMLERLRKGGLPHDDAFINDDDDHVIPDSDDEVAAYTTRRSRTTLPKGRPFHRRTPFAKKKGKQIVNR